MCRVEAGKCVSRPEGTVCDDLANELRRFEAWADALRDVDGDGLVGVDSLRTDAEAAVRYLVTSGVFAGAEVGGAKDGDGLTRRLLTVKVYAMRAARLGRYQPYFDASSVVGGKPDDTERGWAWYKQTLVDKARTAIIPTGRDDDVEARTLACAVLVHEWMQRPEFTFDERFVTEALPLLVTAIGDRLFGLGTPRTGVAGESWYKHTFTRWLAQTQTAITENTAQLGATLARPYAYTKTKMRTLANTARRLLGYDPVEDEATYAWASSPHTLFAFLLLRRMM
jgi:hypothetical protein